MATLGDQLASVAVGWYLYERTHSALALGLVGLAELLPVVVLALPVGAFVDRSVKARVAMGAHLGLGLCCLALALLAHADGPVWPVYGLLFCMGTAGAFKSSSTGALLPSLMPVEHFVNANAWSSTGLELSSMAGPALAGVLIGATHGATVAFGLAAALHLGFVAVLSTLPRVAPASTGKQAGDAVEGLRFVFRTEALLAAITLDLFAVLFGGATALLPIFAKDLLQVGPEGLGWLRAAPSFGAFAMALLTTRLPPWKRPGVVLLWVVAGFGLATVGFGLSTSFAFSLGCLVLTGVLDEISVVIRRTLEHALTPDRMRGRVAAVCSVFIGFSNELGSFESGSTAYLFGPVASVVFGGLASMAVVGIAALAWPRVRQLGPLHTLHPDA